MQHAVEKSGNNAREEMKFKTNSLLFMASRCVFHMICIFLFLFHKIGRINSSFIQI